MSVLPSQRGIHVELVTMYPIGMSHRPKNKLPMPQALVTRLLNGVLARTPSVASVVLQATSSAVPMAMAEIIMMATGLTIPRCLRSRRPTVDAFEQPVNQTAVSACEMMMINSSTSRTLARLSCSCRLVSVCWGHQQITVDGIP